MACTGFQRGCTCGPCNARYMTTYANPHTYGPIPKHRRRLSHAVQPGSATALCGVVAPTKPVGGTVARCPDCERAIHGRGFIAR